MSSHHYHNIKHRVIPKDVFYTPLSVVKIHLDLLADKVYPNDKWYDPFLGKGIYYDNFPTENKVWTEISKDRDFFEFNESVDIICSNPPYSILDKVFQKSIDLNPRIISFIIGINNLTPRRIEMMNQSGYKLSKIHITKVYQWFGMSVIVVFDKQNDSCISFDREVHK